MHLAKLTLMLLPVIAFAAASTAFPEADAVTVKVDKCVKAYSDAETKKALEICEAASRALNDSSGDGLAFDVRCVTGNDAFHKYGCGIYDAAMVGTLTLER